MRDRSAAVPDRHAFSRLLAIAVVALGACGGEPTGIDEPPGGNAPPTIGPIADQVVVRNTLTPGSMTLTLDVADADGDPLTVTVTSSDDAVVPGTQLTCSAAGPCELTLTPAVDASVAVTVTVVVSDGRGGRAQTDFLLTVGVRLVTSTDDDGAGSLRVAVEGAEEGDVIGFDAGAAFATPATITLASQITLDRSLTVEGPGSADLAVSGADVTRIFRIEGGARVTLRGLAIVHGSAPLEALPLSAGAGTADTREGGGVLVLPTATLILDGVTVSDNEARGTDARGGGVANLGGTVVLDGSTVVGNASEYGGGVVARNAGGSGAVTTVRRSVIEANVAAQSGGGIGSYDGALRVEESDISRNEATSGS